MKFQKIDQKQLPQVVVLSVLAAAALGWGGYKWFGPSGNSAHAENTTPPPGHKMASASPEEHPAGANPVGMPSAGGIKGATGLATPPEGAVPGAPGSVPAAPGGSLGLSGFNPDPFRAPANLDPAAKPAPKAPPAEHHEKLPLEGPGVLPNPGGPQVVVQPTAPPAPVRPVMTVTGIIDVQGGTDMALVEIASQQRIVQVGDVVDAYKVKKIDLGGVTLVNGKDKYYAGLASLEKPEGKS